MGRDVPAQPARQWEHQCGVWSARDQVARITSPGKGRSRGKFSYLLAKSYSPRQIILSLVNKVDAAELAHDIEPLDRFF